MEKGIVVALLSSRPAVQRVKTMSGFGAPYFYLSGGIACWVMHRPACSALVGSPVLHHRWRL